MARWNQQVSVGDPASPPLPHPPTIRSPSPREVPRVRCCSPQHKNALRGQPWSRELSLGQSSDCHYLQGKKNNLWYHCKLLLKAFLVGVGSRSSVGQGSACLRLIRPVLVG